MRLRRYCSLRMATSSREARRRRILERGSDRLALINGRIQTLPSTSISASPLSTDDQDLQSLPAYQSTALSNGDESATAKPIEGVSLEKPQLQKNETDVDALKSPVPDLRSEIQSSLASSTPLRSLTSASDTEQRLQTRIHYSRLFTTSQIASAISASEGSRIVYSVAIALLVVLSYMGFPLLGSDIIRRILFWRPLYLVLLTDVTVVIALLLLEKRRGLKRSNNEPSLGNGLGWAEQAGTALEIGLVSYKVVGAIFMDFSVYAVFVTCGVSLVQRLCY